MSIKILHAAHMRTPVPGVIRQMEDEQLASNDIGIRWDTRLFCPHGTPGNICVWARRGNGWMQSKREFYHWLASCAPQYDAVLLRYSRCDPFQLGFVKNASIPVFTVHHTLELHEVSVTPSLKNSCRKWVEEVVGPRTLRHVSGVVGVTREISEYSRQRSGMNDLPLFTYSNGATYTDDSVVIRDSLPEVPELLFIASNFSSWIGLDLLVEAVRKSKEQFVIHVVGGVSQEQVDSLKKDSRFVVHGFLEYDSIRALIARSLLGIGSLALYRNKMTEGNTLKVKEYLRAGLPVYAGYRDVFDESFPYYIFGEPNMDDMLAFAEKHKHVNPEDISALARPHIEKRVLLRKIYEQLDERLSNLQSV